MLIYTAESRRQEAALYYFERAGNPLRKRLQRLAKMKNEYTRKFLEQRGSGRGLDKWIVKAASDHGCGTTRC